MDRQLLEEEIRKQLFEKQDPGYKAFHEKLIPTVETERVIGVRIPDLRKMAKTFSKTPEAREYLQILPHYYYDENNLHAFLIENLRDYEEVMEQTETFLPYIDNWATCDIIAPRSFKRNTDKLLPHIYEWLGSNGTYTVRFGIGMLLKYYLDAPLFNPKYLEAVAEVKSDEYYGNMMIAWYFATALAKQYMDTLPYIEGHRLSDWVHRKAIQKSVESRRISDEHKQYLRSLK